jgi:hypothetical protein
MTALVAPLSSRSSEAGEPVIGIGANKGCEGDYRAGIIRIELGEGFADTGARPATRRLAVCQSAA